MEPSSHENASPLNSVTDFMLNEKPSPDVSGFTAFTEQKINDFITAVINVTMFLPYYFSVKHLLKTLFFPWKNIREKQKTSGEGLDSALNRLSFNIISRLVGAVVRLMTIALYLIFQFLFVLTIPIAFTVYAFLLPLRYFMQLSHTAKKQDEEEKKMRDSFVQAHLIDPKNQQSVEDWYFNIVKPKKQKRTWYDREILFSSPPIGRDWTAGFTPTMDQFCEPALTTSYDIHLIGRQNELSQMEHTLLKSAMANILLVGEEGVGRETIIKYFAQKIYYGKVSPNLAYKRVLTIDLQKILSSSSDQMIRLAYLSRIFAEAHEAGNVILVIHDLDAYVSNIENHIDCSDILSKYSNSNSVTIIATTTPNNYQKYVYPNKKIHEIFDKIDINPLSESETLTVLLDLTPTYEDKYKITIPYETLVQSTIASKKYISTLPLPESAIHLLDESASILSVDKTTKVLTPEFINAHLEQELHIPTRMTDELKEKLLSLEDSLNQEIIDQPQAIKSLSSALKNTFTSTARQAKPLATFLFLGPTGVGKTETAKAVSKIFFGIESALIRLDMPNYQTTSDIAKLLGDNENPGILTQKISEQPYGVLLLDEIEKANRNLLNIFLSVLDEGYFTNGRGEKVDCKSLIIIATSNAAADFIFQKLGQNQSVTTDQLLNELVQKNIYTPEFLNRFDGVVMFEPLSIESITKIAKKILINLDAQLYDTHQVHLNVAEQTLINLISNNYNPLFGARDIKRIIDFEIKEKISTKILSGDIKKDTSITI